jgi:hypothetical protein
MHAYNTSKGREGDVPGACHHPTEVVPMKIDPIPGFSALKLVELADLTPAERIRRLREGIERGSLRQWWKQLLAARQAEKSAPTERESAT